MFPIRRILANWARDMSGRITGLRRTPQEGTPDAFLQQESVPSGEEVAHIENMSDRRGSRMGGLTPTSEPVRVWGKLL